MKKFLFGILALFGLLVIAAGLIYVLVPQETLVAKVRPTIGNFRVEGTSFGLNYSTVQIKADVTSQAIPVFVDSLSYQILIADEIINQGSQAFTPESKQGKVQVLEIPVKISHNQLQEIIQLKTKTGAPLVADIQAYCDLPFVGQKQFNIRKDVDIPLPSIPGLQIF